MSQIFTPASIHNFQEFRLALSKAGMCMGGENDEGIFSLSSFFSDCIQWHTENPETDPWVWRIRVLNECQDIAYSKLFFKKSGYITKEWYPAFLSVRRESHTLEEEYKNGNISHTAKTIYQLIQEHSTLPVHELKQLGGFTKEHKAVFDRSLIELQGKLYITMCGQERKRSSKGEEYGWNATAFCLTESFWGEEVFKKAASLRPEEAYEQIKSHILMLNPNASEKKIKKFILNHV